MILQLGGEIAGLTWDRVDLDLRFVRLIETKNGTRRDVPVSTEALRLIRQVKGVLTERWFFS
jgi:integrase